LKSNGNSKLASPSHGAEVDLPAIDQESSAILGAYPANYSAQCGFSGTIFTQHAVDASRWERRADVRKRNSCPESLGNSP
jgi:hypothetical protein